MTNSYGLDLGIRANGERVSEIVLPKWADSSSDFLKKNREALESEYVSENIHLWIDLIFGSAQKSLDHDNLFHPLTYEGAVDVEMMDPLERFATEQ